MLTVECFDNMYVNIIVTIYMYVASVHCLNFIKQQFTGMLYHPFIDRYFSIRLLYSIYIQFVHVQQPEQLLDFF